MAAELVRLGCVSKTRCRPILNGCNVSEFSPEGPLSGDMVGLKRPIWLYCGRVSHEKNILALLHLANRLPGSIAIVGKGPFYDEAVEECVYLLPCLALPCLTRALPIVAMSCLACLALISSVGWREDVINICFALTLFYHFRSLFDSSLVLHSRRSLASVHSLLATLVRFLCSQVRIGQVLVPGVAQRRRSVRVLPHCRCVCVPFEDRHVWTSDCRGYGQRCSRCRVPCHWPD